jgi:hypothetical protein
MHCRYDDSGTGVTGTGTDTGGISLPTNLKIMDAAVGLETHPTPRCRSPAPRRQKCVLLAAPTQHPAGRHPTSQAVEQCKRSASAVVLLQVLEHIAQTPLLFQSNSAHTERA